MRKLVILLLLLFVCMIGYAHDARNIQSLPQSISASSVVQLNGMVYVTSGTIYVVKKE